jgi:hypothetical protein
MAALRALRSARTEVSCFSRVERKAAGEEKRRFLSSLMTNPVASPAALSLTADCRREAA